VAKAAATEYSAKSLSVLEGLDAVRKRPGMYIGSTDSRGLMHCLWEIIDNSVDEALAGHASVVDVVLHPDDSVEVRDNGRGIPVDIEPKTKLSGVELVLTKLHAGGKFGGGSYQASGGLHGVGASVVNALSSRLDVEVDRNGIVHVMSFQRGVPGVFDGDGPDSEFTKRGGLVQAGKAKKGVTGTRTRYWADRQIFDPSASFDMEALVNRARQTAFLVPGLTIAIHDNRNGESVTETFRFDGGISEFCTHLATDEAVSPVIRLHGKHHFHETVQVLDKKGHLVPEEVERELGVDIALRWGTGYDTDVKSFVNIISTPKGGTHTAGFEQALIKAIRAQVDQNSRKLKLGNDKLEKEDIMAGLTAVVTVRLAEPQFEGQTKEVLGTPAVRNIVSNVISKELTARLTSSKRDEKAQSALLLEK